VVLRRPISGAGTALARLAERSARSLVGQGWIERFHFADVCASLWIDVELVHLEDLALHDASYDMRTPTHELTIAATCCLRAGGSRRSRPAGRSAPAVSAACAVKRGLEHNLVPTAAVPVGGAERDDHADERGRGPTVLPSQAN
jgi:hypothetical protein